MDVPTLIPLLHGKDWTGLFGRLHPMMVHLPIGLMMGLSVIEFIAWRRPSPTSRTQIGVLAWLASGCAALAAAMGYALAAQLGDEGRTLSLHRALGTGVATATLLMATFHALSRNGTRHGWLWTYRGLLLATLALLVPAGHLGATMVHGPDYLFGPDTGPAEGPAADANPTPSPGPPYAAGIAPLLQKRCAACHNEDRKKGGLSMHSPEAILAGGKHGPVIVPGKPLESEMVKRLRLPPDDTDHMPPPQKPQPTLEEIELLEKWIAAGASFEGGAFAGGSGGTEGAASTPVRSPDSRPRPAPPEAIDALRQKLVHVEPVSRDSPLLWIDFAAPATTIDDAAIESLLEPVRDQVAELSLARTKLTDASLALLARMPHLRKLDLRATSVTTAGLALLDGHSRLLTLVLSQTQVGDEASETLLGLPSLRRLYLWGSAFSPDAVNRLREARPDLQVDAGDRPDSTAQTTEDTPKLSSDAPIPGAAPAGDAQGAKPPSLTPINQTCPVSGQPVNTSYAIVFEGRVIGFCCPNCPSKFWADPAAYRSKLP